MKRFLFLSILISSFLGFSQLTPEEELHIEALQNLINSDKHDTIRVNAMKEWSDMVYYFDPTQDSLLLDQIIRVCDENLEKEISAQERRFYMREQARSLDYLGTIFLESSRYETSLEMHQEAIELYSAINQVVGMDGAYINMGNALYDLGRIEEAIKAYHTGVKLCDLSGNMRYKANGVMSLGIIYIDMGELDKAQEYLLQGIDLAKSEESLPSLSSTYLNMGNTYSYLGDLDSALVCYNLSFSIAKQIQDEHTMGTDAHNIGEVYMDMGMPDSAFHYLMLGHELRVKNNRTGDLVYSYSGLCRWYSEAGQHAKAIEWGLKGLNLSLSRDKKVDLITAAAELYKAYERKGDYKRAYETYQLYEVTEDSIETATNQKALIEQEVQYAYERNKLRDSLDFAQSEELSKINHQAELDAGNRQRYLLFGGLLVVLIVLGFAYRGYRRKKADNAIIIRQKEEVEEQKQRVEEAHKEITDSINYAKRIQSAILPPMSVVKEHLPDSFVLYEPKDVVAGDFYWLETAGDQVLFAAADCTGHGVPGAMVSVVCNNGLNRSVREHGLYEPAAILDKTREIVVEEFAKSEEGEVKDGMDIALACFNPISNELSFAGAHNPLWIVRNGELLETKGDKQPIGKFEAQKPFTQHQVKLEKGDVFYLFTDGFADQFGGDKGKKFKAANFKKILVSLATQPMEEQQEALLRTLTTWRGDLEQLDDICVIGVRV